MLFGGFAVVICSIIALTKLDGLFSKVPKKKQNGKRNLPNTKRPSPEHTASILKDVLSRLNCYGKFKYNLLIYGDYDLRNINNLVNHYYDSMEFSPNYIYKAFNWEYTSEGNEYWYEVNMEFKYEYESYCTSGGKIQKKVKYESIW
jgi:hypothetical protein